jgi:crossover junction endodeoxyribonuclease RuvC
MQLPYIDAVILAVDPGLSGSVCRLEDGVLTARRDFTTRPEIAYGIQALAPGVTHLVTEFVCARPGQGVVSMFSFGRSTGVIDGAFALCFPGLVPTVVTPQVWQKFYRVKHNIPKEKEFDSREIACALFPSQTDLFRRKLDHNTADAALMAWWRLFQLNVLPTPG